MKLETVLQHYIAAALWSSVDHGEADIAPESLAAMREDCRDFIDHCDAAGLLADYPGTAEQFGHDFWLTRNHHGAGFWDRGLNELGNSLTHAAHDFGSRDLYLADDGQIWQS